MTVAVVTVTVSADEELGTAVDQELDTGVLRVDGQLESVTGTGDVKPGTVTTGRVCRLVGVMFNIENKIYNSV